MSRAKVFISTLMVLILIALSGASVWAAPNGQEDEGTISGRVERIVIEVDETTGTTTVLVTLIDELGETQTVRLSLETATTLGLVPENVEEPVEIDPGDGTGPITGKIQEIVIQVDETTGTTTVLVTLIDELGETQTVSLDSATAIELGLVTQDIIEQPVDINPEDVLEVIDEDGEEAQHPVASALADFFATALGLDYDTIMAHHESGIGFGVIAQACWMSYALEGDVELLETILNAKKSGDFSAIMLSEDGETARNWGQFKKAVLKSDNEKIQKNLANLGAIMSRRAEPLDGTDSGDEGELGATSTEGKVKGKKDQGGGKPDAPPGQVKNKDKGKGGGKNK